MEEQKKTPTVTASSPKELVVGTVVITSTVVLTIGAWKVVGELVYPPLHNLNKKLRKKSEERKTR